MNHMKRLLQRIHLDPKVLLSGILVVLSFPPWDLNFLIWVALIPWFLRLNLSPSLKSIIFDGYWLGALMTLGGFSWVAHSVHHFGNLPWVISYLALILFTLICQPQFWFFTPFYFFTRRQFPHWSSLQKIVLLSLAYVGIDSIFPKLFLDALGNSLYRFENLRQIAEISGVSTLSFLVIFTNLTFTDVFTHWRKATTFPTQTKHSLIALILIFALSLSFGVFRRGQISELYESEGSPLHFALIQGNIGNFEKVAAEEGYVRGGNAILETYFKLSAQALEHSPRPDFIVWPETAYSSAFAVPRNSIERYRDSQIKTFVKEFEIPLLFGGYDSRGRQDYNAFHFLIPQKVAQKSNSKAQESKKPSETSELSLYHGVYHKYLLLPFAEYMPGHETFDFLKNAIPEIANFGRGLGPLSESIYTADGKHLRIAPEICYEVLEASFVREQVLNGAQLLLNITNDSWFGDSIEPYQHLALATLRSVETRVPLVRATNTGISTWVNPTGELKEQTRLNTKTVLHAPVAVLKTPPTTLFLRFGNWLGWLGIYLVIGLFLKWFLKVQKQKQS